MFGACEICEKKCPTLLCDYNAVQTRVAYPQWISATEEKRNRHGEVVAVKVTQNKKRWTHHLKILLKI
jgi:hypothetical protein